jgi:hypothetical protein
MVSYATVDTSRPVVKSSKAESPTGKGGGAAASRRQRRESSKAHGSRICWPVLLFLVTLMVPWVISIGSFRMSLYRIVLIVMVVPCLVMWATGRAGRIRVADISLLLFTLWATLGLVVVNGPGAAAETAGIRFIETMGAYMLARCYVRDADQFYYSVKILFRVILLLMPFAMFEFVTSRNVSHELFAMIGPTFSYPPMPPRWGLTRVQSVFDHPILFGVCTGGLLALVHLVLGYQESLPRRSFRTLIVGVTAFMSLSAGPISAVAVQAFLLAWNGALRSIKNRWTILIALFASAFLLVEAVANRSALNILVSLFVFEPGSYWFRKLIWEYGTAAALNHPLFGVGLDEWPRPAWMPPSIDNFWLIHAVLHGLPAAALMPLSFVSIVIPLAFRRGFDGKLREYRTGFLITMTALALVGWTVHFWNTTYVLVLFLLGSGVWMLDMRDAATGSPPVKRVHNFGRKALG